MRELHNLCGEKVVYMTGYLPMYGQLCGLPCTLGGVVNSWDVLRRNL
jgi:hypothetical protein